ncbi:MAG: hypothetical protein ABSA53_18845 [Streptosporangiaceae bacterium]
MRATNQAGQIAEPAHIPAYEPIPATWFSLSSTSGELDRARSGPVPPREPDQRPGWEMGHDRPVGAAVQEKPEAADLPWWENRLPQPRPASPPQPRPASPPQPRPAPPPARTQAGPPAPPLVATPEDQAQSEAAAAAPQSYITLDDRKKSYAELGVPESLDPLSSSRFLGQLARRFALYSVVTAVADVAYFLLGLAYFLVGKNSALLAVAPVAYVLSVAVLLLVFLLMPVPALLGQWSRLLSFQAAAAHTALDCVAGALEAHATPNDKLGIRLISPDAEGPGEGRRHFLELRHGYFAGYVSCFPHGHDLYVGWTFWIRVSPIRVLLMRIGRKVQDYTGRGNDMYQTLRFETVRATVAAIHTCTLEGVDVATAPGLRTAPGLSTAAA